MDFLPLDPNDDLPSAPIPLYGRDHLIIRDRLISRGRHVSTTFDATPAQGRSLYFQASNPGSIYSSEKARYLAHKSKSLGVFRVGYQWFVSSFLQLRRDVMQTSNIPPLEVHIIRGPSGIGKTTFAEDLRSHLFGVLDAYYADGIWHLEADQFMTDPRDRYRFEAADLKENHARCQEMFRSVLYRNKTRAVIVSNTFIQDWELSPYLKAALSSLFGSSQRRVLTGVYLWEAAHRPGFPQEVLYEMNRHGVPEAAIARQVNEYEPINLWGGSNRCLPEDYRIDSYWGGFSQLKGYAQQYRMLDGAPPDTWGPVCLNKELDSSAFRFHPSLALERAR